MEYAREKIWKSVMEGMKVAVSMGTFNTVIKKTELMAIKESGDRLICEVGCTSGLNMAMLDQRFYGQLAAELERVTGKKCEIRFVATISTSEHKLPEELGPLFDKPKKDGGWKKVRLKENYTFENFAVGVSNQMAYAAAQAVVKRPGDAYNPLFIYGGVGVGKTHLMEAIGHALLEKGEDRMLFCSAEEFTNDLVEGIKNKSTERVRGKYRNVKLLMIDDVQFIAGRVTVQEEFFHTFNSLVGEGGQIVMTSDRPPAEINKLEERLRSRFGAGMVVDVGPADLELRTAILLIKAKQRGMELPMEAARVIAESVEGLRELEGFLVRLLGEVEMKKEVVSVEMVERLLKIAHHNNGQARIITPNEIMNLVGNYFGVGLGQLKGDRRMKNIVWPRQILMYLLRTDLKLPQEEVGRLVGGRDHTTVIHATGKVTRMMLDDEAINKQIGDIRRKLWVSS